MSDISGRTTDIGGHISDIIGRINDHINDIIENKIQIDNLIIYLSMKITKGGKRSVFECIETYDMQNLLQTRRIFLSPHQATKGSR